MKGKNPRDLYCSMNLESLGNHVCICSGSRINGNCNSIPLSVAG